MVCLAAIRVGRCTACRRHAGRLAGQCGVQADWREAVVCQWKKLWLLDRMASAPASLACPPRPRSLGLARVRSGSLGACTLGKQPCTGISVVMISPELLHISCSAVCLQLTNSPPVPEIMLDALPGKQLGRALERAAHLNRASTASQHEPCISRVEQAGRHVALTACGL